MKNPFIDLIIKFDKLNVAPELEQTFKNVIRRMAVYFEANGYLDKRDYTEMFKKYLIDGDFKFEVSDEPSKIGAGGFYNFFENRIVIDSNIMENGLELEQVLCHEFIHFLVMHDIYKKRFTEDKKIRFINEAFTESLARNIYPEVKTNAYEPQVKMMDFANILMGKANNYGLFLQTGSDGLNSSAALMHFIREVNSYHSNFSETGFLMGTAAKNEDYINAQRDLINICIKAHNIKTVDQYVEVLEKLLHRPVEDAEFISKLLDNIENFIISSTLVAYDKKEVEPELKKQLKEMRDTFIKCKDSLYEDVYEFEFDGQKLFVGKDYKLKKLPTSNTEVSRMVSTYSDKFILKCYKNGKKTEEKTIYFKDMVFENPLKKAVSKTKKMINTHTKNDIRAIYSALDADKEIVSIERFDLPNISGGKNNVSRYVVRYTDGIEILDSLEPEEVVEDVRLADFKGIVGDDPKNGLIWFEDKKDISGYSLSSVTSTRLAIERRKELRNFFISTFSKGTKDAIIQRYKESEKYDPTLDEEDIEDFALDWFARDFAAKKSEDYFEKIDTKIKSELPEMVIYTDGNEIGMGTFSKTVYDAEKTVLYSKNGGGLYDDFVPTIKRDGTKRKVSNLYKVNKDGSLVLNPNTTKKTENILEEQAEKLKEEKIDTPLEDLGNIQEEISEHRKVM